MLAQPAGALARPHGSALSGSAAGSAALAAIPPHGYQAKGMRRDVLGFLNHSYLDYALEDLDLDAVGTIAFFSILADRYGRLTKQSRAWTAWTGSKMTTLIQRAHDAKTAVVLSVTRFAWDSAGAQETVALLSSSTARARLANEIADAVVARKVDGVNIDVEPIPSGQRANFVSFVRAVRRELTERGPGYQLTVASTGHIGNYDVTGITAPGAANAIYIMGYQYRGNWSYRAGSTAPVDSYLYDLRETVRAYLARAPASKVILGVPYYGYTFSTVGPELNSRTTGYARSVLYAAALRYGDLYGRNYDPVEEVTWTAYRYRPCSTCTSSWRQTYFETERSLGAKYDLVNANDLRGTGIWALGYEGHRPGLFRLLEAKFGAP
jgi:spore germination protein YaaH